MFVFFFFKQKTAYEMRISDWSSDVCSSDLAAAALAAAVDVAADDFGINARTACLRTVQAFQHHDAGARTGNEAGRAWTYRPRRAFRSVVAAAVEQLHRVEARPGVVRAALGAAGHHARSEEHKTDLQSLMLLSYA